MCSLVAVRSLRSRPNPKTFRPLIRSAAAWILVAFGLFQASLSNVFAETTANAEAQAPFLGARTAIYYNPERSGEGVFVELLGGGRALVYFFSYGPRYDYATLAPLQARQTWLVGLGTVTSDGTHIQGDLVMPTGGRFGAAFNPHEIEYLDFGMFSLRFPTCGTSEVRGVLDIIPFGIYGEPITSFEPLEFMENYVQLTQVLDCETGYAKASGVAFTGSWYDASRPGEGLVIEVLQDNRTIVQWMTYDNDGGQMWVQGVGVLDVATNDLRVDNMRIFKGTYWGSGFDPAEVTSSHFGSLTIHFFGCNWGQMTYESPSFGSGVHNLTLLTTLTHINDSGRGCWDY